VSKNQNLALKRKGDRKSIDSELSMNRIRNLKLVKRDLNFKQFLPNEPKVSSSILTLEMQPQGHLLVLVLLVSV
jgi:hypothetical protein